MIKGFLSQIKDIDEKGIVTVAANAFGNVDSQKDMSMEGSYSKTINENFPRLKWFLNHNPNILLGVPLEAKEAFPYLQVRGQLNMKKEVSRDTYEDYKLYAEHGRTLEHSVGVDAVKWVMKGEVRQVTEWKWWEYSTLTNWGANEKTPMLNIKSAADLKDSIDWMEVMLKHGNYTDEKFSKIQKHLEELKTLVVEPVISTLDDQPQYLEIIKQFRANLKTS